MEASLSNRCLFGALVLLSGSGATVAAAAEPSAEIHTPDGERPPVLDRLGPLDGFLALAIGPDGRQAAVALEGPAARSVLRIHTALDGEPAVLELGGRIRDLLYSADGTELFGLQHKPARKREGDTYLIRIEPESLRARQELRLPPSARTLDHAATQDALLVACRDEIRTVLLPDLRSGPLYRVLGENLSVASLPGGSRVIVGQRDHLLLVDLADPSGRLEMPVRERIDAPGPLVSLAAASDGNSALARTEDGRLFRIELAPLSLVAMAGPATLARGRPRSPSAPAPSRPAAGPPGEPPSGTTPSPPRLPAGPPPPPRPPEAGKASSPAAGEPPQPTRRVEPAPPQQPPTPSEPAARPGSTAPTGLADPSESSGPEPRQPHRVHGRVTGAASRRVAAVVLHGPDNLLREAARVRPDDDGHWSVGGLAPGRYRVTLDEGSGRVLVSEPAFLVLDVGGSAPLEAPELRVVRVF